MHLSAAHGPSQLQVNSAGELRHFLTTEGLSLAQLTKILDTAEGFFSINQSCIANTGHKG